jgi:hypothetical protein
MVCKVLVVNIKYLFIYIIFYRILRFPRRWGANPGSFGSHLFSYLLLPLSDSSSRILQLQPVFILKGSCCQQWFLCTDNFKGSNTHNAQVPLHWYLLFCMSWLKIWHFCFIFFSTMKKPDVIVKIPRKPVKIIFLPILILDEFPWNERLRINFLQVD